MSFPQGLYSHKTFEYTLSSHITKKFNKKMKYITVDPYLDWSFYTKFSAQLIRKTFPKKIVDAISNMSKNSTLQTVVLHNVPVDTFIPHTPHDGKRSPYKGFISESVLLGLCDLLGCEPFLTFPNAHMLYKDPTLKNNLLCIHQIIPLDDPESKLTRSSSGSAEPFDPHTEAVQCRTPIKFFLLYCLRGDPKVATNLIFLDDLLKFIRNHLPHDMSYTDFITELQKSQFLMSNSSDIKASTFEVVLPILTHENKKRIFRFDSNGDRITGTNPTAQRIVNYIKTALHNEEFKAKYVKKFYLKKGDLLIFNNLEILHARDSFTIDPDNWRWLQRLYCCKKL